MLTSKLRAFFRRPANVFIVAVVIAVPVWIATCAAGLDDRDNEPAVARRTPRPVRVVEKCSNPPSAHERAAKKLEGYAQVKALSREMEQRGFSDRFEVNDLDDDVINFRGTCTQSVLDDLAARMKQSLCSYGFRRLACLNYTASLD